MNILLTDLNSLPLDMPQRPATAAGSDASFNHLFREQLPVVAAGDSQAVEFKHFFGMAEVTAEMPPRAPQALPTEFTAQFPRQRQDQFDALTTAMAPPVEVALQAPFEVPSLQIESAVGSAAEGLSLPQGGNPLPAAGAGSAPGEAAVAAPAPAGQAVGGLQFVVAATTSTPPSGAAIAAAADYAPGRHTGRAPAPAQTNLSLSQDSASASTTVSPRAASQPIPGPLAGPDAAADDSLAQAPRVPRPPLSAGPQMAYAAPRMLSDTAASAVSTARGGAEILPAPPTPGHAPLGIAEIKRPDSAAIEIPAAPRGAVAVDNARQAHSHAPAEFVAAALRLTPEAGAAGGEAGARSMEMPMPASGAQVQTNAAASLPPPALAPVQTVAPAQLTAPPEALGLARGADATDWGNAVGERVSWMINHKQNSASIRLDPPMLGKLDVQVRVSDDATTITIQTQHAQTRDLIDAASLRLRDYLQENGFQNVNVDVSQRQDQQQARAQSSSSESGGEQADAAPERDSDAQRKEAAAYTLGEGLLDTFA